jgi:hypothetical protein
MPSHARYDLEQIAKADMDVVVHMLSHIDWTRHKDPITDIFRMTESLGMEVWVDNWGLAGAPGDSSHFLCAHPDGHMIFSNGEMHPKMVCYNNPEFITFVKEWIDTVAEMGAKTVFWDEPFLPKKELETKEGEIYTCCCPRCKKLFEEKYNRPMPLLADEDVAEFRKDTLVNFFRTVTDYSALSDIRNTCCFMPGEFNTMIDAVREVAALPHMDNLGVDPYWYSRHRYKQPYEYVYGYTKKMMDIVGEYKKEHNVWIQTYAVPAGREEEIVEATEAAYDAGGRCILAWSYGGGESNTYRADRPERTWIATVEAMRRVRQMERDRVLAENRAKYMK